MKNFIEQTLIQDYRKWFKNGEPNVNDLAVPDSSLNYNSKEKFDDLKKSLQKTKSTNKLGNNSESDSDQEESDDCDKQYMLLKPKRQKL